MRRPARGRGAPGCGQFPRFPALGACPRFAIPRGQARRTVIPGPLSNPASGCACTGSRWSSDGSRLSDSAAIHSAQPRLRAVSNVDGIVILADDASKRLPRAFPTGACPRGVTLEAPATVPDESNQDDDLRNHDMRCRFHSWSDRESRSHEVAVPATGGRVRLELTRECRLRASARNQADKNHVAIDISPPSGDGFDAEGTRVQVAANPAPRWHFPGWTGEVPGSEPRQAVVMDAAKSLAAVFARSEPLRPGATKDVTLRTSGRFQLHGGRDGWNVLVPPDAAELTLRFRSSSAAEAHLYVRRGSEVRSEPGDAGETPRIHAAFESTSRGASEKIATKRKSTPRMASDVYRIGLAVPRRQRRIRGTLSVDFRHDGSVKARPGALAFASPAGSDPGPQTIRLNHEATAAARYRIVSNATWLRASPQAWVHAGTGVQEAPMGTADRFRLESLISFEQNGDVLAAEYRASRTA